MRPVLCGTKQGQNLKDIFTRLAKRYLYYLVCFLMKMAIMVQAVILEIH